MADAPPVLQARDVRKTYGERVVTEVLKGIDFDLRAGEFCALTGPSGSGKTTFLNLLGLLDRPTGGEILVEGRPTGDLDDGDRTALRGTRLGFVFQFHHLLPAFTLLEEVGLADRARYRATDLSGGQQQRVAIARALVVDPVVVLADEPTGNLDTQAGAKVLELLHGFNERRGTAFLVVTHDDAVAHECRRIVHMVDGKVDWDRVVA